MSTPFSLEVVYFDVDGTRVAVSSEDFLEIPRIARFFAESSGITATKVST